ncbi:hypothetical protein ACU686_30065 [Yinghuangia aomiensis]
MIEKDVEPAAQVHLLAGNANECAEVRRDPRRCGPRDTKETGTADTSTCHLRAWADFTALPAAQGQSRPRRPSAVALHE